MQQTDGGTGILEYCHKLDVKGTKDNPFCGHIPELLLSLKHYSPAAKGQNHFFYSPLPNGLSSS